MKSTADNRAGIGSAKRVRGSDVTPGGEVKLSPGGPAELLDISATGALVETSTRFSVGATVRVLVGGARPQRLAGRVVRSSVCAIHRDSTMSYQVAIEFDDAAQVDVAAGETPEAVAAEPAVSTEEASVKGPSGNRQRPTPIVNDW